MVFRLQGFRIMSEGFVLKNKGKAKLGVEGQCKQIHMSKIPSFVYIIQEHYVEFFLKSMHTVCTVY